MRYINPRLTLTLTLLEFRLDFWHQKTRIPGLSYGIVCVILYLAVLVQCQLVTDGRTHNDSIYCASIVSRGKNATETKIS